MLVLGTTPGPMGPSNTVTVAAEYYPYLGA